MALQFSDLPKEIRLLIWDHLLEHISPRNIYLQVSITSDNRRVFPFSFYHRTMTATTIKEVRRNVPRPPSRKLAQINRENRDHLCPLLFATPSLSSWNELESAARAKFLGARFNPQIDTLVLSYAHHSVDASKLASPLIGLGRFADAARVRKLKIDNGIWQVSKWQLGIVERIERFAKLRCLCLVGGSEELLREERKFLERIGVLAQVELGFEETVDGWLGGDKRRWVARGD